MIYVPNKLVFYHVPKTGGSWFIFNMVKNVNEETFFGSDFHWTRTMFVDKDHWLDIRGLPSLAFVRNPITWYLSFWKHKNRVGWTTNNDVSWFADISRDCKHADFEEFLKLVLERHPGFLTRLYKGYLGERFNDLRYVVKQENLLDGCCKVLRECGIQYDEKSFRVFPRNNVAPKEAKVPYSPELKSLIASAESEIMIKFNYKEVGK